MRTAARSRTAAPGAGAVNVTGALPVGVPGHRRAEVHRQVTARARMAARPQIAAHARMTARARLPRAWARVARRGMRVRPGTEARVARLVLRACPGMAA